METTENKLIAEFMGYKLVKCNNGQAWESPHEKDIDDIFNLHGRLWRENEFYYKWETSWDWLMPVYFEIQEVICPLMDGTNGEHENSCADMGLAILDDNKEEAIKQAIIAINWYNKQKEIYSVKNIISYNEEVHFDLVGDDLKTLSDDEHERFINWYNDKKN